MEIVTLTFLDTVLLDSPSIWIGAMADTFHMIPHAAGMVQKSYNKLMGQSIIEWNENSEKGMEVSMASLTDPEYLLTMNSVCVSCLHLWKTDGKGQAMKWESRWRRMETS